MEPLRVLELYSGIGGMHYALKESGVPVHVVAAVDINTTANLIYKHNFPDTTLWNKTIEGISLEDFNKLSVDMILMSPPCQPFTRLGLQGDVTDARTKSFLYVLDLLPRLCRLPRFILLENVKGFETSAARERLVKTLTECGYHFLELLVSPTSVGIPNSRLRYFLLARISKDSWNIDTSSKMSDCLLQSAASDSSEQPMISTSIHTRMNHLEDLPKQHDVLYKLETMADSERKLTQNNDESLRQIQDFLVPPLEGNVEHYLLPPKTLLRYGLLLDIVEPTCRRSVCFTKGYGRYVEGTGSVLKCCKDTKIEEVFTGLDDCDDGEKLQRLSKLKLRYFTPREVANLMGFPQSFSFPEQISTVQRYRVLGNSLNVVVVARLLQLLVN